MIEDTLIHFKTKTAFNTELEAGNIKDTSVVFIKETLEIYTHGTLYSLKDVLDEAKQYTDNELLNYVVNSIPYGDGVYAVDNAGNLVNKDDATTSCIAVALIQGNHKIMIEKNENYSDSSTGYFYWGYDSQDLSIMNYDTADGVNPYGVLGVEIHTNYMNWTSGALSDFNGKSNTDILSATATNDYDMGLSVMEFNKRTNIINNNGYFDWYIPSLGQFALIMLNIIEIDEVLDKIGGKTITDSSSVYFHTSSEYDANASWICNIRSNDISYDAKTQQHRIRLIRNINPSQSFKEYVDNELDNKADKAECVVHNGTVTNIVSMTQEEYDALETKNSTTLYIIIES